MERNALMGSTATDADADQDILERIVRLKSTNARASLVQMVVYVLTSLLVINVTAREDIMDLVANPT